MASLSYKIEAYLERKVNFHPRGGEIRLQDDGQGVYIKYWSDAVEKPQPTAEQLEAVSSQADADYNSFHLGRVRKKLYGRWQNQLDQLYHDIEAGKLDETGEWFKAVKKVKDDNPKP